MGTISAPLSSTRASFRFAYRARYSGIIGVFGREFSVSRKPLSNTHSVTSSKSTRTCAYPRAAIVSRGREHQFSTDGPRRSRFVGGPERFPGSSSRPPTAAQESAQTSSATGSTNTGRNSSAASDSVSKDSITCESALSGAVSDESSNTRSSSSDIPAINSYETPSILRKVDISPSHRKGADGLCNKVKLIMRYVPQPVAIITSTDVSISPEGAPSAWRGATVSSFNTVSLHPRPIVSFNIKKVSSTYEAIKHSGLFNVALLAGTPRSEYVASQFSSGNVISPFHREDGTLAYFARKQTNGLASGSDEGLQIGRQPPFIDTWPDPQFTLRCRFISDKVLEIADHVVLLGVIREAFMHRIDESSSFMYYVSGGYRAVNEAENSSPFSGRLWQTSGSGGRRAASSTSIDGSGRWANRVRGRP